MRRRDELVGMRVFWQTGHGFHLRQQAAKRCRKTLGVSEKGSSERGVVLASSRSGSRQTGFGAWQARMTSGTTIAEQSKTTRRSPSFHSQTPAPKTSLQHSQDSIPPTLTVMDVFYTYTYGTAGWMALQALPLIAAPQMIVAMLSPEVREATRTFNTSPVPTVDEE
jgi:hypothetical protein